MLRFTIRDMLWLTALVAMGAAWCGDRFLSRDKLPQVREACADALRHEGFSITFVSATELLIEKPGGSRYSYGLWPPHQSADNRP